jgi:two-component system, LytTR family, sensor kinase
MTMNVSPPLPDVEAEGRPVTAPRRLALLSILGFWAFYFAINTFRAFIGDEGGQFDMIARRTFVSLVGIALTFILYLVLERRARQSTANLIATVFVASVPVSLAYGAINFAAFYLILPSEKVLNDIARYPEKAHNPLLGVIGSAVNWYFFIVAWGVFYIALAYAERVRHADSLSALVLAGRNDDAERMILNLANFFRASLARDAAVPGFVDDVPLSDEIALQRLYLDIERVRFPDRLRVVIDVPDALLDAAVPGLILQPLVENAIKHGVARSRKPVTLTIRARAAEDRLSLFVEDDGRADAGLLPASVGTGTGVRNVCERLAARFGDAARCESGLRAAGGFGVTLVMPLSRMAGTHGR